MSDSTQVSAVVQGAAVDNRSYVYVHKRADNNEVFYVGIGTWGKGEKYHRAQTRSCRGTFWKRVAEKYGRVAEIVAEGLTRAAACNLECVLIAQYGRQDTGTGSLVNLSPGGDSPPQMTPKQRLAHIERMRGNKHVAGNSFRKGTKHSEETRRKISAARKGRSTKAKGRPLSAERREQISRVCKGRPGNSNRLIIDLQTGIYYDSIKDAATALEVPESRLRTWLAGIVTNQSSLQFCDTGREGVFCTPGKLVIDLQTGIYYKSVREAAETIGVCKHRLGKWLRGVVKNKSSFQFC